MKFYGLGRLEEIRKRARQRLGEARDTVHLREEGARTSAEVLAESGPGFVRATSRASAMRSADDTAPASAEAFAAACPDGVAASIHREE